MKTVISAGAWKTNITPPIGVYTAGSFLPCCVQEIFDELYSNAVVFDDGNKEIAVVSVDVVAIPDKICGEIIDGIEKCCGIPRDNIIITATHTHTGPILGTLFSGVGEVWEEYIDIFKKCVVTSAAMAKKKKQPVRIGAGKGINDKHVFNRRLKRPDGTIIMNWNDKNMLQDCIPSGPVDPEVIFITVEDIQKKPIALLVNYANHNNAVCSDNAISADWSGYMAKTLAKVFGDELVTLFLPGACGNINWVDYRNLGMKYGVELALKIGMSLAGTVLENMSEMEYPEITDIDAAYRKLLIPDRPFCDYDTQEDMTFGDINEIKFVYDQYRKEKKLAEGKDLPVNEVDIHVVRIGDSIAIATNPGELFVEYGMDIKERSPFRYTMVSELSNGYAGYICTRKAFGEGGYEVRKTNSSSHLDIGAGEDIVAASAELLCKIKSAI